MKSQKRLSKVIKKYLNLFNAYFNYHTRTSIISNYPVIAFIDPTSNCNLHCPACPTGLRLPDRHRGMLTIEEFKGLIDEIGDYLFLLWMYNWGEPTLHPDFPEMVKYASDKGISVMSMSNFSNKLSDEYIRRIVFSGLDILVLSVDGITQETYSRYRKGGNLNIVLENIKKIHDIKIETGMNPPEIRWKFLVFKHNEHEIEELKKIYKKLGADELVINGAFIPENSKEIQAPINPLYPQSSSLKYSPTKTCSQLYGTFVYNPNGLISPCCGMPTTNFDFFKYDNNGVLKAMNSEKFIKARLFFKKQNKIFYNKSNDNGLKLNAKLHESGIVCMQCPTPNAQDGAINILYFFSVDFFNIIKHLLSADHQKYLQTKWSHWKTMMRL